MKTPSIITAIALLVATSAHAQTRYTNADLHRQLVPAAPAPQSAYDALKAHEYQAPVEVASGPVWASTGAHTATSGPWEWPHARPARRLDGTLLSAPPVVYGAQRAFSVPRFNSGFTLKRR